MKSIFYLSAGASLLLSSTIANDSVSFERENLPLLEQRCNDCHYPEDSQGGLDLPRVSTFLRGGDDDGPSAIPGKPGESPLLLRVTGETTPRMPEKEEALPDYEIDLLKRWIAEGAVDIQEFFHVNQFAHILATLSILLPATTQAQFTPEPFLKEHCVRCHGAEKQKGDLRLDTLSTDFNSSANAAIWIEVMDNLNLDEMPPEDEPRPNATVHAELVGWIAQELREAQKRAAGTGGRVLLRRLNRTEYANTIRDLLHLPPYLPGEDPTTILPPDATYEGFDKAATALMLDPSLLENYFMVAKEMAYRVMVDGPPPLETSRRRGLSSSTLANRDFSIVAHLAHDSGARFGFGNHCWGDSNRTRAVLPGDFSRFSENWGLHRSNSRSCRGATGGRVGEVVRRSDQWAGAASF